MHKMCASDAGMTKLNHDLSRGLCMQGAFLLATLISVGVGIAIAAYCLVWARTKRLLFLGDQSQLAVPFIAPVPT